MTEHTGDQPNDQPSQPSGSSDQPSDQASDQASDQIWRSFTDDLSATGRGNPIPGLLSDVARTLNQVDAIARGARSAREARDIFGAFTTAAGAAGGAGGAGGAGSGRGPKARRGDVRTAILDILSGGPLNGYQVIQAIADRTDGAWKPSPGSVYPTIQQLEDEGLITGVDVYGRRLLELTGAGRAWVDERRDQIDATWQPYLEGEAAGAGGSPFGNFGNLGAVATPVTQLITATVSVMATGTSQQRAEAVEILNEARARMSALNVEEEK